MTGYASFGRALAKDERGGMGAEFGLLIGVFLLLLFGIIDAARFAWSMSQAQKATQAAVRHAVVTDSVADGLDTFDFTRAGYFSGDRIPAGDIATVSCTSSGCGPTSLSIGGATIDIGFNSAAFASVLARARRSFPALEPANLQLRYEHVGLGFAGNPVGSDIAPLVIVRISGVQFQPMILFGGGVTLPDVEASLTMEDGQGTASYSG